MRRGTGTLLEVGLEVARLGHQQSDLHQGEDDSAYIFRASDAPVGQHSLSEEAELLRGKIPAGPGQLGARSRGGESRDGSAETRWCQYEEVRALVIRSSPGANSCHHVVGQLQLVH